MSESKFSLLLDENKPEQKICERFLNICGRRKKSRVVSFLVEYFLDSFGLDIEDLTIDDIEQIMNVYPVIKKMPSFRGNSGILESANEISQAIKGVPVITNEINTAKGSDIKRNRPVPSVNASKASDDTEGTNQKGFTALEAFGFKPE